MPAIEVLVAIPKGYPSNVGPVFLVNTPFYEPFKDFLYEKLAEKWYENNMVVYEVIVYIQDEFLNAFLDSGNLGPIRINEKG